MEVCKDCGVELIEGDNWCKSRADKKHRLCKGCARIRVVAKKASDEEFNSRMKEYYKEYRNRPGNKEKQKERSKKWKENNKEASQISEKKKSLKYKYGISLDEYKEMFKSQGGACAICGITEPEGKGSFHLDHDHTTGKVRGILCNKCNHGIGLFKDNPVILSRAIEYLGGSFESNCN